MANRPLTCSESTDRHLGLSNASSLAKKKTIKWKKNSGQIKQTGPAPHFGSLLLLLLLSCWKCRRVRLCPAAGGRFGTFSSPKPTRSAVVTSLILSFQLVSRYWLAFLWVNFCLKKKDGLIIAASKLNLHERSPAISKKNWNSCFSFFSFLETDVSTRRASCQRHGPTTSTSSVRLLTDRGDRGAICGSRRQPRPCDCWRIVAIEAPSVGRDANHVRRAKSRYAKQKKK